MKKMGKPIARVILLTIFVLFLTLYLTQASNYNEYNRSKTTALTKEEIALFEKEVQEGKEIDPSNYLKRKEKNYENKLSQMGLRLSTEIGKLFNKGMNAFFKALEEMAKTSNQES